jgi:hypothetical protein
MADEKKEKKPVKSSKKTSDKKKKSSAPLNFGEYQKAKGADPFSVNGFSLAAKAKNLDTTGSYEEETWDLMFSQLK